MSGRIGASPRLQSVFEVLRDGKWHSTWEMMQRTQSCAVGSAVRDLRKAGLRIDKQLVAKDNDLYYEYRLVTVRKEFQWPQSAGESASMANAPAAPDEAGASSESRPLNIIAIQEVFFK